MALNTSEKELLAEGLAKLSPEDLQKLKEPLERLRDDLDRANSSFPETQKFLAARGLTNVKQLDAKGRQELLEHLSGILRSISN